MRCLVPLVAVMALAISIALVGRNPIPFGKLPAEAPTQETKQSPKILPQSPANQPTNAPEQRTVGPTQQAQPAGNTPTANPQNTPIKPQEIPNGQANQSPQEIPEWSVIVLGVRIRSTDGLLALFTGFLVMAGIWQGHHLRRSVIHLETSAVAAKDAANVVVSQLRAYVSVVSASVQGFTKEGAVQIQVRIANTGQTPAFNVANENGATVRVASVSGLKGGLWPEERMEPKSKGALGPHATYDAFIVIGTIPQAQKEAIGGGVLGLFAYGEIHYNDVFGNPRFTKYRLMYGGGAGANAAGSFVVCEEGNDQD